MSHPLSPYGNAQDDLLYWLKLYISRKSSTLSSGAKTDEDAEKNTELRDKIRAESTTIEEVSSATLEMARNGFKSILNYTTPIINFVAFCRKNNKLKSINDISAAFVQEDYFGSKHYKASATKKNHYRAIVGFINYIQRNNTIDENGASYQFGMETMPRSYDAKKIPETLLPNEFERFIAYINEGYSSKRACNTQRNRLIIKIVAYTGMRAAELTGLTKKSIYSMDSDQCYPVKIRGKGDKERMVYIEAALIEPDFSTILKDIETDHEPIFDISETMLYLIIKEALGLAGLKKGKKGPHLLRHSYATYLHSKKVGLAQIQKLLGHENISTTTIYAKVIDKDIKDAALTFSAK